MEKETLQSCATILGIGTIVLVIAGFILAIVFSQSAPHLTIEQACQREFQSEGADAIKQCEMEAALRTLQQDAADKQRDHDQKMRDVMSR